MIVYFRTIVQILGLLFSRCMFSSYTLPHHFLPIHRLETLDVYLFVYNLVCLWTLL
jgi:hypothetical protein